jgi:phosphatidylglycerol:prolipoprotein diacylglycerol transferase
MFLHYFHPQPLFFSLGPFQIHWYGFLIMLAVLISFFIALYLFKKYKLPVDQLYNLFFYLIIFGILGARLWHVLSEFGFYKHHLLDIFKIWNGGLAIHGAILGGAIVILFFNKKLLLLDIFAPLIALGLVFGRWGNYFNQELYGPPTTSAWGIPIDMAHRLPGFKSFQFFQPIFLYESLWCLLLFAFLIYLHQIRIKNLRPITNDSQQIASNLKKTKIVSRQSSVVSQSGFIFLSFLILYSIERFLIGFLRIDPQLNWLGLRLDQWVSLSLIIISVVLLIVMHKKYKTYEGE